MNILQYNKKSEERYSSLTYMFVIESKNKTTEMKMDGRVIKDPVIVQAKYYNIILEELIYESYT